VIDLFSTPHKFQPLEKIENLKIEIHKQRPSFTGFSRFSTGKQSITTGFAPDAPV
jgi:hypothetical protein